MEYLTSQLKGIHSYVKIDLLSTHYLSDQAHIQCSCQDSHRTSNSAKIRSPNMDTD